MVNISLKNEHLWIWEKSNWERRYYYMHVWGNQDSNKLKTLSKWDTIYVLMLPLVKEETLSITIGGWGRVEGCLALNYFINTVKIY